MEKICKRCLFRTPNTRAICQVCGHAKFFPLDNSRIVQNGTETAPLVVAAVAPAPTAVCENLSALVQQLHNEGAALLRKFNAVVDRASHLYTDLTASAPASVKEATARIACQGDATHRPAQATLTAKSTHVGSASKSSAAPAPSKPALALTTTDKPAATTQSKAEKRKGGSKQKTSAATPAAEAPKPVQTIQITPTTAIEVIETPTITTTTNESLNELLSWFESYGKDGNLILPDDNKSDKAA